MNATCVVDVVSLGNDKSPTFRTPTSSTCPFRSMKSGPPESPLQVSVILPDESKLLVYSQMSSTCKEVDEFDIFLNFLQLVGTGLICSFPEHIGLTKDVIPYWGYGEIETSQFWTESFVVSSESPSSRCHNLENIYYILDSPNQPELFCIWM